MKLYQLGLTVIVLGLVVASPVVGCVSAYKSTQTDVCFKVTHAERKVIGEESKWVILTDQEAYENTDSLLFWKFNSSTLQGRIEEGKSYRAEVVGWRVPMLSMYQNILNVEEVNNCYEN